MRAWIVAYVCGWTAGVDVISGVAAMGMEARGEFTVTTGVAAMGMVVAGAVVGSSWWGVGSCRGLMSTRHSRAPACSRLP